MKGLENELIMNQREGKKRELVKSCSTPFVAYNNNGQGGFSFYHDTTGNVSDPAASWDSILALNKGKCLGR
jgi:hypothetical protein